MRLGVWLFALGLLAWPMAASAQTCNGQFPPSYVCGNVGVSTAPPNAQPVTAILDTFGTQQGTVLNRGASVWSETATPVLGVAGSLQGSIGLAGATAGVATIQSAANGSTWTLTLPANAGTNSYVLTTDGSGNTSWANPAAGGTVTSVGLAAPAEFTVTGSPVTLSGTLTFSKNTQLQNLVYASPNGSTGVPVFRSLVGADLPNPTLSTLGGVEAINAVASNWIRSINTSGVPQLSQPAFTDISGSVGPAQLPTPTAITLGGVFSLAPTTSLWINSITTAGQPVASQPSFSDIAGTVSASQLPTIGNNTILSNISGSTIPAQANQISAIFDATLGSAQGDVLYRDSGAWMVLTPGTMGQVLTTGGAAANPSWTTVTGTGTVTEVDTSGGITGGPITASGTVSLASISTGHVLGYTGAGSGTPVATTPSVVLDVIGATEGDILYRGASTWSVLGPGSSGQFLQTNGGGATPSWANVSVGTGLQLSGATVELGPTQCTSWTPTDQSGASLTFSAVSARYCQYGNIVFVNVALTYPATGNGSVAVISLPVAVPNQSYANSVTQIKCSASTGPNSVSARTIPNTSTAGFYTTGAVNTAVTNANLSGLAICFSMEYPAS